MSWPHILNLCLHIAAGSVAIAVGLWLLARPKGGASHRYQGRVFVALVLLVCASAAIGSVFFRFIPLFAALTLLMSYQILSGWRVIYSRAAGPSMLDGWLTVAGVAGALLLGPVLLAVEATRNSSRLTVVVSLAALVVMLVYDSLRWLFPRAWHGVLWRYEHIYKMVSCLFGLISAVSGNLLRSAQPWSQILPSAIGFLVLAWFFTQTYRTRGQGAGT